MAAGNPERGGICASFVIDMAKTSTLKFGTMQGYMWGVCAKHMNEFGGAGNPLDGVQDWSKFMNALEVQTWVDSSTEPRRMIPFRLFVDTLLQLNPAVRKEAALGCLMCMCYYTMSRSETPLPKSHATWDNGKHLRRRDVRLLFDEFVEWGLGSIKQDKKNKRSAKDPDKRDWKPCGEAGGVLSMRYWYECYCALSSWEDSSKPFFYGEDGKCLIYYDMLKFMRACMCRVPGMSVETAALFGFHGLRVLGYNCWRAASGEEVAVLQGGWGSVAHRAYARDELTKILGMAKIGVMYAASNALIPMPLDVGLPDVSLCTGVPKPPTKVTTSKSVAPVLKAPTPKADVFTTQRHITKGGRKYNTYLFDGKTYSSMSSLQASMVSANTFLETLTSFGYGLALE